MTATAQNIPSLNSNIRYGVIETYTFNNGTNVRICQMWYNNADSTSSYVYVRNGTGTVNNITWGSWTDILYTDGWKRLITLTSTSYIEGIIISNKFKILHIHFNAHLAGNNITFGQVLTVITDANFKPTETKRAIGDIDIQGGRIPFDLDVNTTGEIKIYPMMQNQYTGTISNIIGIYGDLFYLIN